MQPLTGRSLPAARVVPMSKREVIDEILNLNPTADPGFLAEFDITELSRYRDRLVMARCPYVRTRERAETTVSTAGTGSGSIRPKYAGAEHSYGTTAISDSFQHPRQAVTQP